MRRRSAISVLTPAKGLQVIVVPVVARLVLALVGTACLLTGSTRAQASDRGAIAGTVRDANSGKALAGVNVQVEGTVLGASTDARGNFLIGGLPPGKYALRVSMIGYRIARVPAVEVAPGATSLVSVELAQTVVDLNPVVVTADKGERPLDEAANSVAVLGANQIRLRQALRVDQALEMVPGVSFVREQVNIRGSTGFTLGAANRTLLLVDGVPVMASDTGEFNWDLLPVLDIERIEVVKGAGSALWGSAALGGVINIITKGPSEEGRLSARVVAGEYTQPRYPEWRWTDAPMVYGRADVSYSRKYGPFGMRMSVGRHVSTGYTEVGDFRRWNVTGKFTYTLANGSNLVLYGGYNYNLTGIFVGWDDPRHPFQVRPSNRNRAKIEMANCYARYHWVLSPRAALKFRVSYLMTLMGSQFVTTDFNPAHGWGAEVQGDLLPSSGIALTYGAEWRWDTGNTKYFGEHQGYTVGLYGQSEFRLWQGKLHVTPGLRYDRYQLIGGVAQALLSPRLGLNWRPLAGTVVRASAGSGFRAATIAERYLDFENRSVIVRANPELKAETSWSYDAGLRQYLSPQWYVELSAFRTDFDDLIEVDLKQSQIELGQDIRVSVRFQNLQRARVEGVELATSGRWWRDRIGLQAWLTLMDPRDLTTGRLLTYRPKAIGHLMPTLRIGPLEFQAEYRYASRIEAVKLFQYDERVPQKVLNLRLIWRTGPVEVEASMNNALDYYYTQIERTMGEIRNVSFGIRSEF